jgi:hypothetical protein
LLAREALAGPPLEPTEHAPGGLPERLELVSGRRLVAGKLDRLFREFRRLGDVEQFGWLRRLNWTFVRQCRLCALRVPRCLSQSAQSSRALVTQLSQPLGAQPSPQSVA